MGTWGVSKEEIVSALTEGLDDLEGDFDNKTLLDSLEFMKSYSPTSDSTKKQEKIWRKKLKELDD